MESGFQSDSVLSKKERRIGMREYINDIGTCVSQAREIQEQIQGIDRKDQRFIRAFQSLSGDKQTGLLAFGIWRRRMDLLSSNHQPQKAGGFRVSRACFPLQKEHAASKTPA
jgi:hypothetical protein